MKNAVNQRIREIMFYFNFNRTAFAEKINVPQTTISSGFKNDTNPSIDVLTKITNTFPELNPLWLLFGKGEMLVSEGGAAAIQTDYKAVKEQLRTEIATEMNENQVLLRKTNQLLEKNNMYLEKEIQNLENQLNECKESKNLDKHLHL